MDQIAVQTYLVKRISFVEKDLKVKQQSNQD